MLAELGQRITVALGKMSSASVIDEAVLDAVLKEIATALLQADVNVRLVANMRNNVKKRVNVADMGQGLNKQRVIEKVQEQNSGWLCLCTHTWIWVYFYCKILLKLFNVL